MSVQLELILIAVITAAACSIPGTFLVLKNMSMMSDSITHTILLGIVLAFFMTHDLNSPILMAGAALAGVLTVCFTEMLSRTKLMAEDAAVGIVFPMLFSIAIILISRYSSAHLDSDSVLLGELVFAPFNRLVVFGVDIGPSALYTSVIMLILNISFTCLFIKELKLSIFDPTLASLLGFSPKLLHYALMTFVSFTAVSAFEAAGSVLVVAFMITPAVIAKLLTADLKRILVLSCIFSALAGVLGCFAAFLLDVSVSGSIAVTLGIIFALALSVSRRRNRR